MWFSFWRSRDRFSLDELRYLTDQLMKVQVVNEVNKDFVIEALRSIAELITYGDQHDSAFFEYFMEKQVMGEFVHYMFSNEHINYLITYSFDFRNEELLSYYISFLRAISGKLNRNTISLLVKTQNVGHSFDYHFVTIRSNCSAYLWAVAVFHLRAEYDGAIGDQIVAFPLYDEAIRFAFHEESMVRTAIRALTLNVYHVGDECVNDYVSSDPHADYFLNLVKFFREQCISLNTLVLDASKNSGPVSTSTIFSAVDEIEDNLYYFSDVISAGIPDVGRILTDSILKLLIFPLLLPSLRREDVDVSIFLSFYFFFLVFCYQDGFAWNEDRSMTSLYLLCSILRIVKIKDLANLVAAALFFPIEAFMPHSEAKLNGHMPGTGFSHENHSPDNDKLSPEVVSRSLRVTVPNSSSDINLQDDVIRHNINGSKTALREALLSYVTSGDDVQVLGSLSVLATFLQTKELEETMLDAIGILPQRKQHKKLLLQALVGEGSGEEQLFSSESSSMKDGVSNELDCYLQKLKVWYSCLLHTLSLFSLPCGSSFSACLKHKTLWDGGWLLRQLLPYSEAEFNSHHLKLLKESYKNCTSGLHAEARGTWSDVLITVLCDEWKNCKRAIEASSPRKEPKCLLFPHRSVLLKVFVLLHQVQIFSTGGALPDQPPVHPPLDVPEKPQSKTAGLDVFGLKPGAELKLVDAVPCRISFERGKERHLCFVAISVGTSGWIVLAEELPLKKHYGVVRVTAPLVGCNPIIDDKHSRWLHLRVRPSTFSFVDTTKRAAQGKLKTNALVDGRWTLAFRDEDSCKSAMSMIVEEINLLCNEVERRLKPLLDLGMSVDLSNRNKSLQVSSSRTSPSNSL
ncbi:hypothetical protein C3L33_03866, partial [Rhododendron williamsianum]